MFASIRAYASLREAWLTREHVLTQIGKAIRAHIAVQTVSSRRALPFFLSEGVNEFQNAKLIDVLRHSAGSMARALNQASVLEHSDV